MLNSLSCPRDMRVIFTIYLQCWTLKMYFESDLLWCKRHIPRDMQVLNTIYNVECVVVHQTYESVFCLPFVMLNLSRCTTIVIWNIEFVVVDKTLECYLPFVTPNVLWCTAQMDVLFMHALWPLNVLCYAQDIQYMFCERWMCCHVQGIQPYYLSFTT